MDDPNTFNEEGLALARNIVEKLNSYDEESVISFAKSINIHPGIVVGRLQKEGLIKYS